MRHYCWLVITKNKPTYEELEAIIGSVFTNSTEWELGGGYSNEMSTILGKCDQAKILETTLIPEFFGMILPDGKAIAKYWWSGEETVVNHNFEADAASAINKHYYDCWASVIDILD